MAKKKSELEKLSEEAYQVAIQKFINFAKTGEYELDLASYGMYKVVKSSLSHDKKTISPIREVVKAVKLVRQKNGSVEKIDGFVKNETGSQNNRKHLEFVPFNRGYKLYRV